MRKRAISPHAPQPWPSRIDINRRARGASDHKHTSSWLYARTSGPGPLSESVSVVTKHAQAEMAAHMDTRFQLLEGKTDALRRDIERLLST